MDKKIKKTFVRQLEQSDCGVASLASLIRFFGGDARLQQLREWSGTDKKGTTLLGLKSGGQKVGLDLDGYEAGLEDLATLEAPAILHVIKGGELPHFYVCYGKEGNKFIIGDPAEGLKLLSGEELEKEWQSKALVYGLPTNDFVTETDLRKEKWKWLVQLIREDVNLLTITLVIGLILTFMGMATAIYSQKLIDEILPSKDKQLLALSLGLYAFVMVVQTGLSYLRSKLLLGQSKDFNTRIIHRFYGALMRLPKLFFDNRKVGEMVARMNDTARIQGTVSSLFNTILIDLLMVIVSAIFVFNYAPGLGALALLSIPINAGVMWLFNDKIIRQQRAVMQAYAKNEANYVDTIQGVAPIKEGNKESTFTSITNRIYSFFQQVQYNAGMLGVNIRLISGVLNSVLTFTILGWGSFMVADETLQLGELMAVIQLATAMLMPSVGRLAGLNIQLQDARVAFERMFEFAGTRPEYDPKEEENKLSLESFERMEVQNLAFRFTGRPLLLKNIHFSVARGEMICLLGESGCGKSTILSVVERFYGFDEGEIRVNGKHAWSELSTPGWRNLVAAVPQEIKIFNGTLLDNIMLGTVADPAKMDDSEKEALLTEVVGFCEEWGFDQYFNQFPLGYFTILGEEGMNISGGQRQMVALARALFQKPQLLLLDEATSAMDRKTEAFFLKKLAEKRDEMAIILVTHRIKTASTCNRIYVIEGGTISASGSHQELMAGENFYSLSWKDLTQGVF